MCPIPAHPRLVHQQRGGDFRVITLNLWDRRSSSAPASRIFDESIDGVGASDHFGVVADLAVPT